MIRRRACTSRDSWIVFGIWSGARDLNPGPHGPEPTACRVLAYPLVPSCVRLNSTVAGIVSSCDLACPPVSGNAIRL